jgi:hypothetical protein
LSILVGRKPAFSFELTQQLRWRENVSELLAVMEKKRLIERNARGPWYPTKACCGIYHCAVGPEACSLGSPCGEGCRGVGLARWRL